MLIFFGIFSLTCLTVLPDSLVKRFDQELRNGKKSFRDIVKEVAAEAQRNPKTYSKTEKDAVATVAKYANVTSVFGLLPLMALKKNGFEFDASMEDLNRAISKN